MSDLSASPPPVEDAELERLAEIRARLDAATPGLWTWEVGLNGDGPDDGRYQHIMAIKDGLCIGGIADTYHKPSMKLPWDGQLDYIPPTHGRAENAAFIAHAHQDVPYLLEIIDRLRSYLSADTRRLDWLIESGASVDESNGSAEDGEPWQCTVVGFAPSVRSTYFWGATAREVIDKAQSAMRESPQE